MSRRTRQKSKPTASSDDGNAPPDARRRDASVRSAPHGAATSRRSDALDHGPSWGVTALVAAAALVMTIVAVAPLFTPRSMLAAMLMTELEALSDSSRPPTIEAVRDGFQRRRDAYPHGRAYLACKSLIRRLADVEESGEVPNQQLLDNAANWAGLDEHNLLTRMGYAAIQDERLFRAGTPAANRYSFMRQVLGSPPTPTRLTTYDPAFCEILEQEIAPVVHRPDVASAIAMYYYYSPFANYSDWFYVLPQLAGRFAALRDDLNAAGDSDAAAQCDRWIATLCIGVLANERETGIQCLAADTLISDLGATHPAIAESMNRLLDEHTRDFPAVGTDRCAQMLSQPPLAMPAYETAVEQLAFFLCVAMLAAGCAAGFVLAVGSIAIPSARGPASSDDAPIRQRALRQGAFYILVPVALCLAVSNIYTSAPPYQSTHGGLAVIHALFALAASVAVLHAVTVARPGPRWADRLRRGRLALVIFLIAGLFLALPARTTAPLLRAVNYAWPGMLWPAGITVLLIGASMIVARIPARRLARSAAAGWLIYAVLAFVAMQLHQRADRAYQTAVVAAYHDPMTARLGPDWQKRFLDPVRNAFDPPLK